MFKDLYVHGDVNPDKDTKINIKTRKSNITTRKPTLAPQRRPAVVINKHTKNQYNFKAKPTVPGNCTYAIM